MPWGHRKENTMQWISVLTISLWGAAVDPPVVACPPPAFPIFTIHVRKNPDVLRVGIQGKNVITTVREEGIEVECTENCLWFNFKNPQKFEVKIRFAEHESLGPRSFASVLISREGPDPSIWIILPKDSVYTFFLNRNGDPPMKSEKKRKKIQP